MTGLLTSTFLVLTALFPIVNPLGGAPIFLSLTRYYSAEQRKLLSRRIAMNSIALIVASYFVGTHILAFFGIFHTGCASGRRAGGGHHGLGPPETQG
jgi:multiple antibiotic resistance protein